MAPRKTLKPVPTLADVSYFPIFVPTRGTLEQQARALRRLQGAPHPLGRIKDACIAYAARAALYFAAHGPGGWYIGPRMGSINDQGEESWSFQRMVSEPGAKRRTVMRRTKR